MSDKVKHKYFHFLKFCQWVYSNLKWYLWGKCIQFLSNHTAFKADFSNYSVHHEWLCLSSSPSETYNGNENEEASKKYLLLHTVGDLANNPVHTHPLCRCIILRTIYWFWLSQYTWISEGEDVKGFYKVVVLLREKPLTVQNVNSFLGGQWLWVKRIMECRKTKSHSKRAKTCPGRAGHSWD